MKKEYGKALANVLIYLIAIALIITVVPRVIIFFLPFVIGWLISVIANPIVKFFEEKIKFKRKTTSVIAIVLILLLVISMSYAICYFLVTQGIGFIAGIPDMWPVVEAKLNRFGDNFNALFRGLPAGTMESLNDFGNLLEKSLSDWVGSLGTPTINAVSNAAKSLPSLIVAVIMGILSAYFFTTEHNTLSEGIARLLPKSANDKLMTAYRGLKRAIGGYFKAQFKIEIWVYIVTLIGLLILRIDYAVIIALGIAFLDLLPLFGAGLIMVPWAVIALVSEDYFVAVGMLVVWGIGQLVRQLIQPKIVGDSVGLAPLPTLFLLFLGFEFGGVLGMIIAVPIGIIVVSLYEEGLFKNLLYSLRVLWEGISEFRHFTPEEIQKIENKDKKQGEK